MNANLYERYSKRFLNEAVTERPPEDIEEERKSSKEEERRPPVRRMSSHEEKLGKLSAKYESGNRGSEAIGWDSTGGTSYGKYQIASKVGRFKQFVDWADKKGAKDVAQALKSAEPFDTGSNKGKCPSIWRQLASEGKLEGLEHKFIEETHYIPAMEALASSPVKDIINKSSILKDVLWSTAVQHGPGDGNGAAGIFKASYKPQMSEGDLIKAIYKNRTTKFGASSAQTRSSVMNRLQSEMNDALKAAGEEPDKLQQGGPGYNDASIVKNISPGIITAALPLLAAAGINLGAKTGGFLSELLGIFTGSKDDIGKAKLGEIERLEQQMNMNIQNDLKNVYTKTKFISDNKFTKAVQTNIKPLMTMKPEATKESFESYWFIKEIMKDRQQLNEGFFDVFKGDTWGKAEGEGDKENWLSKGLRDVGNAVVNVPGQLVDMVIPDKTEIPILKGINDWAKTESQRFDRSFKEVGGNLLTAAVVITAPKWIKAITKFVPALLSIPGKIVGALGKLMSGLLGLFGFGGNDEDTQNRVKALQSRMDQDLQFDISNVLNKAKTSKTEFALKAITQLTPLSTMKVEGATA